MANINEEISATVTDALEKWWRQKREEFAAGRQSVANGDSLTVEDVARIEHVHPETVRSWCRSRRLKSHRAGRQYRVRPDDLAEFLSGPHASEGTETPDEFAARILARKRGR